MLWYLLFCSGTLFSFCSSTCFSSQKDFSVFLPILFLCSIWSFRSRLTAAGKLLRQKNKTSYHYFVFSMSFFASCLGLRLACVFFIIGWGFFRIIKICYWNYPAGIFFKIHPRQTLFNALVFFVNFTVLKHVKILFGLQAIVSTMGYQRSRR